MKPITLVSAPFLLGAALFASVFKAEGRANEPCDEIQIKHRKSIEADDGPLHCVAFSPNGEVVACCGVRFVQLFNARSGARLKSLDGHTGAVNYVAFSPDGKLLASAGQDQTIRLWEVGTWKPKGVMKKSIEDDKVPSTCLAFSPDGKTLASCSSINTRLVWLWDVEEARWEHIVSTPHRHACLHLAFSPDGKHVAVAGALNNQKSGQVSLHEVNVGLRFVSSWEHDGKEPATCVAFSPDSKTVASAGSDNSIRLWDMKAARERLKLIGPKGAKGIRAAAFLSEGDRIVSVTFEETVQLWDAAKGTLLATATGTDKGVRSMALSTDGNTVATCGEDKVIKLWEIQPTSVRNSKASANDRGGRWDRSNQQFESVVDQSATLTKATL